MNKQVTTDGHIAIKTLLLSYPSLPLTSGECLQMSLSADAETLLSETSGS